MIEISCWQPFARLVAKHCTPVSLQKRSGTMYDNVTFRELAHIPCHCRNLWPSFLPQTSCSRTALVTAFFRPRRTAIYMISDSVCVCFCFLSQDRDFAIEAVKQNPRVLRGLAMLSSKRLHKPTQKTQIEQP